MAIPSGIWENEPLELNVNISHVGERSTGSPDEPIMVSIDDENAVPIIYVMKHAINNPAI
jgi:hypothetical protein